MKYTLLKDKFAKMEENHRLQNEAYRMEMEEIAWQIWREKWKPSVIDRLRIFLHVPRAGEAPLDAQELCRIRYLQHREKHPFA